MPVTERLPIQPGNWDSMNNFLAAGHGPDGFELVTEIILEPSPSVGSSGTITSINGVSVNTFADAANSFATWTLAIPQLWVTFDVKIEHFVAAGTGNIAFRADAGWLGTGDAVTVSNSSTSFVAASTTLATSTIAPALPVTTGKLLSLRVIRLGNDAGDTVTAATVANVRAVRLVRAS